MGFTARIVVERSGPVRIRNEAFVRDSNEHAGACKAKSGPWERTTGLFHSSADHNRHAAIDRQGGKNEIGEYSPMRIKRHIHPFVSICPRDSKISWSANWVSLTHSLIYQCGQIEIVISRRDFWHEIISYGIMVCMVCSSRDAFIDSILLRSRSLAEYYWKIKDELTHSTRSLNIWRLQWKIQYIILPIVLFFFLLQKKGFKIQQDIQFHTFRTS